METCLETYVLDFHVGAPRRDVFNFVSNVHNLDAMTPAWLRFTVRGVKTTPIELGSVFDYRLRWHGLPMLWRSEIVDWTAHKSFTYVQRRGPYRQWIHEHEFSDSGGGTHVVDRVRFRLRGPSGLHQGPVGRWVLKDIRAIFEHRASMLQRLFGVTADEGSSTTKGPSSSLKTGPGAPGTPLWHADARSSGL